MSGASSAPALIAHNSAGPAATFQSGAGVVPFTVNSSVQVPSLNASLLGGHASGYFLPTTSRTTFTLVKGNNVDVSPGSDGTSSALCPSGSGPVGGGFNAIGGGPGYLEGLAPLTSDGTTADGWAAVVGNPATNAGTLTFHAWAVCANQTINLP